MTAPENLVVFNPRSVPGKFTRNIKGLSAVKVLQATSLLTALSCKHSALRS